jgi:drug/metabolite transporter (DMT)-like permease
MQANSMRVRNRSEKTMQLNSVNEHLESNPCEPVILTESSRELDAIGMSARRARLLALTASLMWSTSGFFVKSPYFIGWPGPLLAFWRAVFACAVLWPMVRNPRWSWWLIPMTLFFAGMNYTYLTAMVTGTAANAIWLQCTAPVWVLLVGVIVFRERASVRDWLMVAFAMFGVSVIIYHESRGADLNAVGWGLASGAMYAGVVLSLRYLRGLNAVSFVFVTRSSPASPGGNDLFGAS